MQANRLALLKWLTKLNVAIWIVNFLVFALIVLSDLNDGLLFLYFSKVLFLEAGIFFVIGGIVAFSSSALSAKVKEHISKSEQSWSIENLRQGEKRANKYLILAIALFVQSIIVSLAGF